MIKPPDLLHSLSHRSVQIHAHGFTWQPATRQVTGDLVWGDNPHVAYCDVYVEDAADGRGGDPMYLGRSHCVRLWMEEMFTDDVITTNFAPSADHVSRSGYGITVCRRANPSVYCTVRLLGGSSCDHATG